MSYSSFARVDNSTSGQHIWMSHSQTCAICIMSGNLSIFFVFFLQLEQQYNTANCFKHLLSSDIKSTTSKLRSWFTYTDFNSGFVLSVLVDCKLVEGCKLLDWHYIAVQLVSSQVLYVRIHAVIRQSSIHRHHVTGYQVELVYFEEFFWLGLFQLWYDDGSSVVAGKGWLWLQNCKQLSIKQR